MREGILRLNRQYRDLLSNDLGAAGSLLFDVGSGRYPAPPREGDDGERARWEADLAAVRAHTAKEHQLAEAGRESDRTHTEVQRWLRDLGCALGFDVYVAANDRGRPVDGGRLGDGCRDELPPAVAADGAESVRLIDVIWLERSTDRVAAAFEVEHTTSIYSGIVRLLDLALGVTDRTVQGLFLVAPDSREQDVRTQLQRPAFQGIARLHVRFLPYSELERHRDAMARFGAGLKAIEAVARTLV